LGGNVTAGVSSLMRRFLRIGAAAGLAAVVTLLAPIWLPFVLVQLIQTRWRRYRFRATRRGQLYLVWHARRGWYDFVRNNVLPRLPESVQAIQDRSNGGVELRDIRDGLGAAGRAGMTHPFLAMVGRRRIFVVGLHEALRPHSVYARRDAGVQAQVGPILARAAEDVRATVIRTERN
jgi:hypothetical protein